MSTIWQLSDGKGNTTTANQTRRRPGATVAMVTITMTMLVWCDVVICATASSSLPEGL